MGRKAAGVRAASETSIEIDFRYRGVRCRERINLAPTPRNLAYAERFRGAILIEIAQGTFEYAKHFPDSARARKLNRTPGAFLTIAEALRTWLGRKTAEIEHSTQVSYERAIENTLIPAFGTRLVREIGRDDVADWVATQKASAKRLNNVISPLRQMLNDVRGTNSPFATYRIKRRRAVDKADDIDPFSPVELKKILAIAEGQVRNLIQFAAWSGLRTSELIALRWDDVDLAAGTVRVRAAWVYGKRKATKTSAGTRTVTLLTPATAALTDQKAFTLMKGARAAVFENPQTNAAWTTDKQIREWNWRPILARAKVRYRYPYQLRHTFASTMLSSGENVFWVAQQMGHRDPSMTTRKYTRFIPSVLPDAGRKAEAVWSTSGQPVAAKPHQN